MEFAKFYMLALSPLQDFPAFFQFAPPLRNLLFAEVKRVAGVRGVRRGWGGGPIPPRGRVVGLRHSKRVCRRTYYKAVRVGVSLVFELVLKSDKGSFFSGQKFFHSVDKFLPPTRSVQETDGVQAHASGLGE